jgi:uncharacterized membrane protein YbhN (UPF0104 family)
MAPAATSHDSGHKRPSNRNAYGLAILVVLAVAVWVGRGHAHLDWASLPGQFRAVSWGRLGLGVALIYVSYGLRAVRWSVLLSPVRRTYAWHLLPAQLIGFTAVAIFGRVADLARPYMIARRLHSPIGTQLAIYSIERAFDLASAAILFSVTLAFAPRDMPHHAAFARAGALSLAATLLLVTVALAVRFAGDALSRLAQRVLHPVSRRLATAAAARVLDLREGFRTISTVREFFSALAISLVMWMGIAGSYLLSAKAFRASPPLAAFTLPQTMLLLASGLGGSLLQLPVLGWFTQIAVLAAALHGFFDVPLETATACGAAILVVTNLCIVPAGLIAAKVQGVGLRETVVGS